MRKRESNSDLVTVHPKSLFKTCPFFPADEEIARLASTELVANGWAARAAINYTAIM